MTESRFITCPLCEATCGLEVTVTDGRVGRIRGDRDDVFSKGFICPKGSTLTHLHDDPDRLRLPVVRRGDRFETVSWDEAFTEIADRLESVIGAHGRESLAVYLGNPNVHSLAGSIFARAVVKAAGTRQVYSASSVDQVPKHLTAGLMWGDPNAFPLPDLDRTDHLLILGANPYASNGSLCTAPDWPARQAAIRARGGKVVVVDPRRSKTAQHADEHIPIRPGTDAWLLVAMINVLFSEDLVSIGRLEAHVAGVDELRALVEPFSPETVAARTGIDASTIRRLAREVASARTAAVYGRMGVHTVEFGAIASWATDVINVITGNVDRPGGVMFASPPWKRIPRREPGGRGFDVGRWHSRVEGLPEVIGEFPAVTLADEIETPGPGQIRALVLLAGNPVRSYPNSDRLDAAFTSLDLVVAVDPYVNESTRHAHVILPARSPLERSHFDIVFGAAAIRMVANWSDPVLETDLPDDADVLARLALVLAGLGPAADPEIVHDQVVGGLLDRELGDPESPIHGRERDEILAALRPRPPAERVVDLQLRTGRFGEGFGVDPDGLSVDKLRANPHGLDFGPLVERLPDGLKTASGMLELAPAPIVADFDRFLSTSAKPPENGLLLVGRRHLRSNNSWMHNVKVLVKGKERCTLQVHPDDAESLGLVDGSSARVTSRVGSVVAPVEICTDIEAGVVSLPHGWGHDEPGARLSVAAERPGVNSNTLTDDGVRDHASGNAVLNAIPVEVEPTVSR